MKSRNTENFRDLYKKFILHLERQSNINQELTVKIFYTLNLFLLLYVFIKRRKIQKSLDIGLILLKWFRIIISKLRNSKGIKMEKQLRMKFSDKLQIVECPFKLVVDL